MTVKTIPFTTQAPAETESPLSLSKKTSHQRAVSAKPSAKSCTAPHPGMRLETVRKMPKRRPLGRSAIALGRLRSPSFRPLAYIRLRACLRCLTENSHF